MQKQIPMGDLSSIIFIGAVIIVLLIIILSLIVVLLKNKSSQNIVTNASPIAAQNMSAPIIEDGINDEVVAVIAAAVAAMSLNSQGSAYAVRGIRRANAGRPAWATAGLLENTRAF